jgi:predicted dehydrogenase
MKHALIIGFGSIGKRHKEVLEDLGCDVYVVSKHYQSKKSFLNIATALSSVDFEYIIIANETNKHFEAVAELIAHNYCGTVLIEKPVFTDYRAFPSNSFKATYIAYNLRFHPLLQKVKQSIASQKVLSAHIYVGQYLPDWRPEQDYRQGYSSDSSQGGGVIRDLSHEIDYALWLFGNVNKVAALGGHISELEISSDDCWGILASFVNCPIATIQLNYLDRCTKREIVINTNKNSYHIDLINNVFQCNKERTTVTVERNHSYYKQHQAILDGNTTDLCSVGHGLQVLQFIAKSELAVKGAQWIQ